MQTRPIQLTDVIYNAANQSFEALVTVYDGDTTHKFACAIDAPITMTFEDAAVGLSTQALRRYKTRRGTRSQVIPYTPSQRAGRQARDPLLWLERLMHLPGRRVA
ncbi:MAG: orotidine 5-phosphate decarboxylase [Sulfitobacter sp.]